MKKTLIALAAVAVSGAAFAQSTVTIGGSVELAPFNTQEITTDTGANTTVTSVKDTRTSRVGTWSTPVVRMGITEDLGGGLRADGVLITEVGHGLGAREHTLGLSGAFGAVRFGRFVPASAVGFQALSGAGSATMLGSMYGVATGGVAFHGVTGRANFERQDNVIQYTSPNFSGFTANVHVASSVQDSNAAASPGENKARQFGLGLNYSAGPIAVAMGLNNRSTEAEGATVGAIPATTRSTLNWVAGSYDFGVARVFAAHAQREDKTGTPRATTGDVNVTSVGVSVPMDAFTFRASMYRGSDDRAVGADDTDLSGYQLAAIYALSKRTSVIAAHGVNKVERDGTSSAGERESRSTTLTVQHTF